MSRIDGIKLFIIRCLDWVCANILRHRIHAVCKLISWSDWWKAGGAFTCIWCGEPEGLHVCNPEDD